jgi:hypothetical protein
MADRLYAIAFIGQYQRQVNEMPFGTTKPLGEHDLSYFHS